MSLSSSDVFEVRFRDFVDGEFIDAWIDVPETMAIFSRSYNVFPYRYRLGKPMAEGYFSMLFFDTPEDRLRLINPLVSTPNYRLPRAIFFPSTPISSVEPLVWYDGKVEIHTAAEAENDYRSIYLGAAIIEQPEYEGSISPLEIPMEFDTL